MIIIIEISQKMMSESSSALMTARCNVLPCWQDYKDVAGAVRSDWQLYVLRVLRRCIRRRPARVCCNVCWMLSPRSVVSHHVILFCLYSLYLIEITYRPNIITLMDTRRPQIGDFPKRKHSQVFDNGRVY